MLILVSQSTDSGFTPYVCIPGFPNYPCREEFPPSPRAFQDLFYIHALQDNISCISILLISSKSVHSTSAYISKHSSCTLLYPKLMQAFPLHIYAFPCPQFPGFPSLTMHARVLGLFVLFIKSFIKPPQAIPVCPRAATLVQKWLPDQNYFLPLFSVMFDCSGIATTMVSIKYKEILISE